MMMIIGTKWACDGREILICGEIEAGSERAKFSSPNGGRVFCAENPDGSTFDITEARLRANYTQLEGRFPVDLTFRHSGDVVRTR